MCKSELLPSNNCCGRRWFEAERTDIVGEGIWYFQFVEKPVQ